MDRQRIEFDEKGIKVYTNNGLIEDNGKTTHTTIEGGFYMSAESVVRLLAHLSESTFIGNAGHSFVSDKWIIITSDEQVKTFVEGAIENVTKSKEYSENVLQQKISNLVASASELDKENKQLRKLIEDHNRGCVGLFHKKIKL
jgi:hypothetical protein